MRVFIKYGEEKGCDYVELKEVSSVDSMIETVNKDVKDLTSNEGKLYSARVLYKGAFGLGYSNHPNWKEIIDKAIASAKTIKKKIKIKESPGFNKNIKTILKKDPKEISLKEKKDLILGLGDRKKFPKIVSLRKIYGELLRDYKILNSYGQDFTWNDSKIAFYSSAFSKEGSKQEQFLRRELDHKGFEIMDKAEKLVNESMDMAHKMLKAEHAIGGNFPVVVDQDMGGVFTHEAVGHATEADLVLQNGSVLKGKLNKMLANPKVTILDDGTKKTFGWLPYDDECSKASATTLIKKGKLVGYLHSLETASVMGVEPTGNGRAQFLSSMIIPRMTTTFVDNGKDKFKKMIGSIKKGYYLKGSAGGVVDTQKGEFLFNSSHGYYIKDGEIDHLVKGPSLMGNIMTTLKEISMVGDDLDFSMGGHCGKCGQSVSVSDGAPHMKIDTAKVGGQK